MPSRRQGLSPNERESLFSPLHARGMTDPQIAESCGVHIDEVIRWRMAGHINANRQGKDAPRPDVPYTATYKELYDQGLSSWEIAEQSGRPLGTILGWLHFHGLQDHLKPRPNPAKDALDSLIAECYASRMTNKEAIAHILRETGETVTVGRLAQWRRENGNLPPHRRESAADRMYMPLLEQGMNFSEIAEATGRSSSTICLWAKRHDPPLTSPYKAGRSGRKKDQEGARSSSS